MSNSKGWKLISAMVLSLVMAASMLLSSAMVAYADEEEYTYKVRIYAGRQGSFENGSEVLTYDNLTNRNMIIFNQKRVSLKDGNKYYVRGIKESGKDNDELLAAASFRVNEDCDYVVIYGILGDAVEYTIRYVDENGNALLPEDTFYGNVGDKPVVAFQYVDGYQPQAYNLTGELQADASKNVFTFVYNAVPNNVIVQVQGPANAGGNAGANNQGANPEGENQGENPEENENPADLVEINDDATPLAPSDMVDLDEEATPLADFAKGAKDILSGEKGILWTIVAYAGIVLLVVLFVVLVRLLVKGIRNKKNMKVVDKDNKKDGAHEEK